MAISDIFKISENKRLKQEIEDLKSTFTPEMHEVLRIKEMIESLKIEAEEEKRQIDIIKDKITQLNKTLKSLEHQVQAKRSQIVVLDEEILVQEFGLYEPRYDFAKLDSYKLELEKVRILQKELIKQGMAITGSTDWSVNGSVQKGQKMVKDLQKIFLRTFNIECEDAISRVKYNNFDASVKKISASRDSILKLGTSMNISVTTRYYDLKIRELTLSFEYQLRKQKEKEEQKAIREQMREEAKLQKEHEEARKDIEKERKHYTNALEKAKDALKVCKSDEDKKLLEDKIAELGLKLEEIDSNLRDIDYREANKRAGYVYIISNIGAFGENVFKIGMTRRLEPMDRVDELGDASVPFDFDVHAMIFSEDAPKLETALHNAFSDRKVNIVNPRREFFYVTLDEVEKEVKKNYDKTVHFVKLAEARQYRESLKMSKSAGGRSSTKVNREQLLDDLDETAASVDCSNNFQKHTRIPNHTEIEIFNCLIEKEGFEKELLNYKTYKDYLEIYYAQETNRIAQVTFINGKSNLKMPVDIGLASKTIGNLFIYDAAESDTSIAIDVPQDVYKLSRLILSVLKK